MKNKKKMPRDQKVKTLEEFCDEHNVFNYEIFGNLVIDCIEKIWGKKEHLVKDGLKKPE